MKLVVFPLLAFSSAALVIGAFALLALATDSLDALRAAFESNSVAELSTVDVVLLVLFYVSVNFVIIFFNAALIAAALVRLRGGNPSIRAALMKTTLRWHSILGWAIIASTVGLVLQMARERAGIIGRIFIAIVGGVWAYLTFFVIPYLVAHDIDPFEAFRRSSSLLKRTWGEQITANFGFGLFYVIAVLAPLLPAMVIVSMGYPIAGLGMAVVMAVLAVAVVAALEGIFKAALFEYASGGRVPDAFDDADLYNSYDADYAV
ncbi:MAG TPA: DUF6159 family protein [Dehalococcoidia bacterium]|nr:DUF6159 family protein [Dehalococcoidia bacterium]